MSPQDRIRVRIAPSPTGYLHIGTARTALFNWLFVKKHGGDFILRIEDTDRERSTDEYEKDIMDELRWLGLEWDEGPVFQSQISSPKANPPRAENLKTQNYIGDYGPYRQSERGEIYEKYTQKLLDESRAYYCFCTKEELEAERQSMLTSGIAPRYSGKCRKLTPQEVQKKLKEGSEAVIRFKMPEARLTFTDMVRDKVSFDGSLIGDIVIARSPKEPLYNYAAVIDDFEMKISHVIRGEDHLTNTFRQIALGQALNFKEPNFAHLPLILNPDRSKMSKRFSAVAVHEYRKSGYLSEALVNFLALLGWHPEGDRELFSREELVEAFDLRRVQKAGAVFNQQKLDWLNSQYIKKIPGEELLERLKELIDLPKEVSTQKFLKFIELERERMKKLTDFSRLAGFLFEVTEYPRELLIWKTTPRASILENLKASVKIVEDADSGEFTKENLMLLLEPLTQKAGRGEVLWPMRAALSGKESSPGPFEIMEVIGKAETLKRLKAAIKLLGE